MTRKNEVTVVQQENPTSLARTEQERDYMRPAADVYESLEAYVLMIDMPGAGKESISVTMDRSALVVKGSVEPLHEEKASLLVGEIRTTGYYRVFNLGDDIDGNTVDARYELGVLTVKLFKKEEVRPREISINSYSGKE